MTALAVAVIAPIASIAFVPTKHVAFSVPHPRQADVLSIRLVDQAMTVGPNGDLVVVLAVEGDVPADAELVVTTYQRTETRDAVRTALELGGGSPNDLLRYPTSDIPRDASGNLVVTIGTETDPGDANRIRMRNPGLYPVSLDIRVDDGDPLASIVTFVERTGDEPVSHVLTTAALVTFEAPPSLQANGNVQISPELRARFDDFVGMLEQSPMPLTVSIRPEILDAMAVGGDPADVERLARLDAALADRHELLVAPYVSMNASAAVHAGLHNVFINQLRLGEDALGEQVPSADLDRSTWAVTSGLDDAGVSYLRDLGVRRLIVANTAIVGSVEQPATLASVTSATGEEIPAVVSDARLERALADGGGDDPVLTAHHVVAELIALALEQDALHLFDPDTPPRGLLLTARPFDALDRVLLDEIAALLGETRRIDPVTADELLRTLERGTDDDRITTLELLGVDSSDMTAFADDYLRVTEGVETTEPMLPAGDARPARWRRLLDVLPADDLDDRQRRSYFLQLDGEIGDLRASVTVQPQSGTVNLGGRRSKVPLTLVNESDTPLTVLVRLTSPGPKLTFPENDVVVTVDDRARVEMEIEARTNGRSPVSVQLFTPDGAAMLTAPQQFTVQATALTGLGQVVTGAFVLILITWWIQHARLARRRARSVQAANSAERHPTRRDPTPVPHGPPTDR